MSSSSACHQHIHQHVTSMSTSMLTHQILVLVEHVKLIWSELAAPVEEIVHCVVARLGPQVGVLHVRQNPMVCLRLVQFVRTIGTQVRKYVNIGGYVLTVVVIFVINATIVAIMIVGTCSMTRVSLVVSSSFISLSSRCCCALSK